MKLIVKDLIFLYKYYFLNSFIGFIFFFSDEEISHFTIDLNTMCPEALSIEFA